MRADYNQYPRLYTAGAMNWKNSEDSYWRRSLDSEFAGIEFFHPEEGYLDHGGDMVDGAVSEDMHMIQRADGLLALISETPQVGTLVEVMHAIKTDTPVLVMLGGDIIDRVYLSECPSKFTPVTMRAEATNHWFLANYLLGDSPDASQRTVPAEIDGWDGVDHAEVYAVDGTESIKRVVHRWCSETFNVELEALDGEDVCDESGGDK